MLSFFVMLAVKRRKGFSLVGVSIAGGVSHNAGQLAVAALTVKSLAPLYYLPVLIAAGAVAGAGIGIVSQRVQKHIVR